MDGLECLAIRTRGLAMFTPLSPRSATEKKNAPVASVYAELQLTHGHRCDWFKKGFSLSCGALWTVEVREWKYNLQQCKNYANAMGPPKVKYSLCCVNICAPSEVKTNYGVLDVAHFHQLDVICPFRSLCRLSYGTPWPSVNNVTAFHRSKMANFGVWWQRLKLHWNLFENKNIYFQCVYVVLLANIQLI